MDARIKERRPTVISVTDLLVRLTDQASALYMQQRVLTIYNRQMQLAGARASLPNR